MEKVKVAATIAAVVVVALGPRPAAAQAMYGPDAPVDKAAKSWIAERAKLPRFDPPRTADGTPDLQGHWTAGGSGDDIEEHPWVDVTTPPQESFLSDPPDGKIPYQKWALAERNRIRAGLARGWPGESGEKLYADPQLFCFTDVPRAAYRGAFQIVQIPGYFVVTLEWGHFYRVIPTDGRPHDVADNVKLWLGNSRAHWEGKTLVVDVTNLNGKLWLDSVGNFYSDTTHIVERWTLVDANTIDYQATIEDPRVYTRPWTINLPFRRARQPVEIWEHACHEGELDSEHVRDQGYKPFWGVTPPQ
jgi:hypothetical protein